MGEIEKDMYLFSLGIWWVVYVEGICQSRLGKSREQKGEWEGFNSLLGLVSKIKSGNQYAKGFFKSSSPKRVLC